MAINFTREQIKFEKRWTRLRLEYQQAGMGEAAIAALHDSDWQDFLADYRFYRYTQAFPAPEIEDNNSPNASNLYKKYAALTATFDEGSFSGHCAWIETVESDLLRQRLLQLSQDDLALVTRLAQDGYQQAEIAREKGCSKNAISKKIKRTKKFLKEG